MSKRIIIFIVLFFISIISFNCLTDRINNSNISLNASDEILTLIETTNDGYFSSKEYPYQLTSNVVYISLDSLDIIDIRDNVDYQKGHIKGAINITVDKIFDHVTKLDSTKNRKIIFVDYTGESSQWYVGLFRLLGKKNVYSMKFGMASWNSAFIQPWTAPRKNCQKAGKFTRIPSTYKGNFSLPYQDMGEGGINDIFQKKIQDLFKLKREELYVDSDTLFRLTDSEGNLPQNYFVLTFGNDALYCCRGVEHPGHPKGAVLENNLGFFSYTNIQKIPSNKKIVIYDVDGQAAPLALAYMKLLGYDIISIPLGANTMMYDQVRTYSWFSTLRNKDIMNYEYITGNQ